MAARLVLGLTHPQDRSPSDATSPVSEGAARTRQRSMKFDLERGGSMVVHAYAQGKISSTTEDGPDGALTPLPGPKTPLRCIHNGRSPGHMMPWANRASLRTATLAPPPVAPLGDR